MVACNAIESARLLLLSASPLHPDGLGNSSGQVGRNYMRHVTGSVYARFDKPVHMYRGETMAGVVADEAPHDADRGFAGGYYFETLALGPPFLAAFAEPGSWGPEFTEIMDAYANTAGLWITGEDMPQETNRITLNGAVTDQHGLPVPNVHFDDHPNDVAMRDHAWAQGEKMYEAVGSTGAHRTTPYPSTHNMGTARMSEKPGRRRREPARRVPRRPERLRRRRVASSPPGRPRTRRSRSSRSRSARRSTSAARSAPAGSDAPLPPHGAGWRLSGS